MIPVPRKIIVTPRRMVTYMIFSAEMRAKVKEENPDFSITDVAKELGVRWKSVTGDE